MAEASSDKPTLLSRLFGRKLDDPPAKPEEKAGEVSAKTSARTSPSWTEGQPDFANAAAAGEITPVAPTATAASPDLPPERTFPAELAGADLQPIEGTAPENRGAEPTGTSAPAAPAATGWWRRLTEGMRRTSSSLGESVTSLFTKRKLDAGTLEELEDALVQADLGVETAMRIVKAVGQGRYDKEVAPGEVKAILAGEVEKVLEPVAKPLSIDRAKKPFVVLMIGVNGSGKTTTIGKLAAKFRTQGLSVMLAAGDTFRAAAIEQLKVWGERTGAPVLAREQGADAAGLAFDALQAAKEKGIDVLLVDTAGRLQNKAGLMAELEKIVRVMRKLDASAPHAVLLVLDATVGQNALSQVELFRQAAGVTGLVMTKLDGTARGGILVALAAKFGVPVHYIGVGEGVEDLEPFAARDFARAIAGLEQAA
jgi:fused signal recognition particle receptor